MQNVFAGHNVLKRSNGYSNQTKLSKEEAKLSFQILLTYFSEEFLKIFTSPFARPFIFPGIIISRIDGSKKLSFLQKVSKLPSSCMRRLSLKNFLAELKIFWECGSQVPILFAALLSGT